MLFYLIPLAELAGSELLKYTICALPESSSRFGWFCVVKIYTDLGFFTNPHAELEDSELLKYARICYFYESTSTVE